jgi:transposase-like protein
MSNRLWREAIKRKRRTHSPEFKSKVAVAAIQGDLTMAEMVKKFDVHANQITEWKKQLNRACSLSQCATYCRTEPTDNARTRIPMTKQRLSNQQ